MTTRQKLAVKKMVALGYKNGGIKGIQAEAMRQAGYSPNTAHTPKKLTQSKGWDLLIEEYLPDDKLLKKHDEALEATKTVSAIKTSKDAGADSTDFIDIPDHPTRLRAVELGYKIKGRLTEGINISGDKVIAILGGATVQNVHTNNGD